MSNYNPQFDPVCLTQDVENGSNRNVDLTFLFDFYAHHRPILHRSATIHNAADRAIGTGRLCSKNVKVGIFLDHRFEGLGVWDFGDSPLMGS